MVLEPLPAVDLLSTGKLTEFSNTKLDSSIVIPIFHYISDRDLILFYNTTTNIHTMNKNVIGNTGITFEQEK